MIWTGLAWSYASLFGARMMLGAWDPCDNPTSQSLLADYYPKVQRSKVMSIYQAASCSASCSCRSRRRWRSRGAGARRSSSSAIPAFIVAILARRLPEPVRGQQDRIQQQLDPTLAHASTYDDDVGPYRLPRDLPRAHVRPADGVVGDRLAVLREHRDVVAVVLRALPRHDDLAGGQPRSACSPSADWPACCCPAGWPTTSRTVASAPGGSSSPPPPGCSALPLFVLTFTLDNTPFMLVCLHARGDVPDRAAGADQRRPRRRAPPPAARPRCRRSTSCCRACAERSRRCSSVCSPTCTTCARRS